MFLIVICHKVYVKSQREIELSDVIPHDIYFPVVSISAIHKQENISFRGTK